MFASWNLIREWLRWVASLRETARMREHRSPANGAQRRAQVGIPVADTDHMFGPQKGSDRCDGEREFRDVCDDHRVGATLLPGTTGV